MRKTLNLFGEIRTFRPKIENTKIRFELMFEKDEISVRPTSLHTKYKKQNLNVQAFDLVCRIYMNKTIFSLSRQHVKNALLCEERTTAER